MKRLLTLLLLSASLFGFGQQKKAKETHLRNLVTNISSIKYSTNSSKELETIDWKDVKSIFEYNEGDEIITMSFAIDLKESKNKFKSEITVSGESKHIDSLIGRSKKIVKAMMNLSRKYESN
jgi:ATP-dependent Clp protease ATP-binding subunit ClpA